MGLQVIVIGAGIIGAASAWELLSDGHQVTLVDPGPPGGPQAASYGNGAWISPASVVPMSMPGTWRKVPGYLTDRNGPLTIRWSHLPRLTPWLIRFLWAGHSVARVEATARALASLLHDSPERHQALAAAIGQPDLIRRSGLLYAYPDRAAFAAEALSWRLRRDNGLHWRELDGAALHAYEPALADHYRFGALVEAGAHCHDPGGYVAALTAAAVARGARWISARATGFTLNAGRLHAVLTDQGPIAADKAVIAAGAHAKALAAQAGDRIPLESERGYHGIISNRAINLRSPVMPSDGKMANTVTSQGLRIAGQVELASIAAAPDWRRVEILLHHALASYPTLGQRADLTVSPWLGHRPSTPDGRPVLSPARRSPDIIHAFGHGHVGLASGPASGRIVADLIGERPAMVDLSPFAARRFR